MFKSASNASGFNPLKGLKLMLPGQYTNPSIIDGKLVVFNVSDTASNEICLIFKPAKFSLVLEATNTFALFCNSLTKAFPMPYEPPINSIFFIFKRI